MKKLKHGNGHRPFRIIITNDSGEITVFHFVLLQKAFQNRQNAFQNRQNATRVWELKIRECARAVFLNGAALQRLVSNTFVIFPLHQT